MMFVLEEIQTLNEGQQHLTLVVREEQKYVTAAHLTEKNLTPNNKSNWQAQIGQVKLQMTVLFRNSTSFRKTKKRREI